MQTVKIDEFFNSWFHYWLEFNFSDWCTKYFCNRTRFKKTICFFSLFNLLYIRSNSKIWNTKNLVITPHVSSDDNGNYVKMTLKLFIKNLKLFIDKKELINKIDKKLGY